MHTKGLPYVEILMRHLPNLPKVYPGNFFQMHVNLLSIQVYCLQIFHPLNFFCRFFTKYVLTECASG